MTTAVVHPNAQPLTEHIQDWRTSDLLVDRSRRLVRNIALTGLNSRNGYRYSEQALRQALPLYENKPVFLDHASNVSRPYERSTRDLVGSIVHPRFHEGRVRSDIQILDTEAGRTFIALAETDSPAVGMSHVVLADRSGDRSVVETIHDVVSVDAVVFPATASTFRESTHPPAPAALPGSFEAILLEIDARLPGHVRRLAAVPSANVRRAGLFSDRLVVEVRAPEAAESTHYAIRWKIEADGVRLGETLEAVSLEQWQEAHRSPRLPTEVLPTGGDTDGSGHERLRTFQTELDRAIAQRDELRVRVDRLELERQATETQHEIEQLLAGARLPACAITDVFRQQLLAAPDRKARQALIVERQSLLEQFARNSPRSRERLDPPDAAVTDEALIAAVTVKKK